MTDVDPALPAGENQTPLTHDVAGIDGAASILGQLLLDTGHPIDRGRLRRVIREAADAFPGEPSQLWWRWISEAGTNLGLKCKVVDCNPEEFRELARDGARLVLYVPGSEPWRAVTDVRGRKFRLARAFPEHSSQWGNASRLREFTGNPGTQDMLRCVIVERSVAYGDAVGIHAEQMSPPARLWALLRPERSDIFVILVYSLIVGLLALATPIAFQSMVDTVAFGRFLQPLVVLTLLLLAFMSFSAAIQGLESYVVEIIQCRLFARVTADLAYRLPRVRTESQDGKYMPELVNRFFDIVTVQKVTAKLLLDWLTLVLNTLFLEVPVQRRKARGKMTAVEGKLGQLAAKRRMTADKIATDVQAVYAALLAAYQQIARAHESAELADRLAEIERRKFELGESDLLSVNLREQQAAEAQSTEVDAMYEYFAARADYRAALARD